MQDELRARGPKDRRQIDDRRVSADPRGGERHRAREHDAAPKDAATAGSHLSMGTPLAPEASLRDRIGRAEAEATRLAAERARVTLRGGSGAPSRRWCAALAASIALGMVSFAASFRAQSSLAAERRRDRAERSAEVDGLLASCREGLREHEARVLACESTPPLRDRELRVPTGCPCLAGDPLCACD
jgi:hypothetical protein